MALLAAPGNIVDIACKAVRDTAAAIGGEHAEKGGYLRFHHVPPIHSKYYDVLPLYEGWVGGGSNAAKAEKYKILSMEKMIRMVERAGPYGQRSSWASRNPDGGYYGGAVLPEFLVQQFEAHEKYWCSLSFSGLTEEGDEAAMLLLAHRIPAWLVEFRAIPAIIKRSENELARKLLDMKV